MSLSPGQVLNERYWIQRLLGRGGMGEVWHAVDLKLHVDVALKTLHPRHYADERRRELLRREVRAAREVISPNVCRVYDLVEVEGRELLSMEHIDGQTLLSLLKERCPLPLTEARDLALQFLAGLEAVHEAGLVHRDFKPENVMITRSGRVVVMDFGIAQKTEAEDGSVSGTPAYMAPEQSRGEPVDARTDVYAVGVVLAEMVSQPGIRDRTSRKSVWEGIREDPPRVPDSPWSPVIRKAVSSDPANRPASAQALIRALEEITLRVEGAEEKHPYPGLASFTEGEAAHFFGREAEVESMWRKLPRVHLLALVGPSGAGKSSFLRAGLIPALPEGWGHVYCQPGEDPLGALAQALTRGQPPEAEQSAGARRDDPETLAEGASRWREGHTEGLVILDQFEELFTLNTPEVQTRFVELMRRLVSDADVRVLVSMRDDFLFHCQGHEPLSPLFSELTPLGPPTGAALNRALVQPALSLGYRFEDESLVTEMLEEVSRERGALPLLAFAAAGLWERRDPDEGLLTREAYEAIGGVGGALAQHAEATLKRIGVEREPILRELFRNLVTAQGTRAVRDREELLSVFDDASSAEEVLGELVAARLLTEFDVSARESTHTTQRVEVIHESLLRAWPRLVRWQTQDADGAQLRDQLREAARLWDEKNRPDDLLWTDASYLEYRAWRERYTGGLTATEEAFARAMLQHAGRRRRRRRVVVAASFVALVAVLVTIAGFWRDAVLAARRSEASKLLALARLELEQDPSAALAHALASLELADSPTGRRFALEVLWKGPTRIVVGPQSGGATFSPDGRWLGSWGRDPETLELRTPDGAVSKVFPQEGGAFFSEGPPLRLVSSGDQGIRVRDVAGWEEIRTIAFETAYGYSLRIEPPRISTGHVVGREAGPPLMRLQSWPLGGGGPELVADLDLGQAKALTIAGDARGRWFAYADRQDRLFVIDETGIPRLVGGHDPLARVGVATDGQYVAGAVGKEAHLHRIAAPLGAPPDRILRGPHQITQALTFSPDDSWLAGVVGRAFELWDLTSPAEAEPLVLSQAERHMAFAAEFGPESRWLATVSGDGTALWPLAHRYPRVLKAHERKVTCVAFDTHGRWMVSGGLDGIVRLWSLDPAEPSRVLLDDPGVEWVHDVAIDPEGRRVLVAGPGGAVWIVSLDGGPTRALEGFGFNVHGVTFARGGRLAVATGMVGNALGVQPDDPPQGKDIVRIWDLETGETRVLDPGPDKELGQLAQVTPDGRLATSGSGVRLWDLDDGTFEIVDPDADRFARSPVAPLLCAGSSSDLGHWSCRDLRSGRSEPLDLTAHGEEIGQLALDPTGKTLVTGDTSGVLRVAPLSGGEPHLLLGHEGPIGQVVVSPDGRWIASSGDDGTVRLWPMPEGEPFHALPREELLSHLRALTNLRVVEDAEAATGYRLDHDPFPGWERVPTW